MALLNARRSMHRKSLAKAELEYQAVRLHALFILSLAASRHKENNGNEEAGASYTVVYELIVGISYGRMSDLGVKYEMSIVSGIETCAFHE